MSTFYYWCSILLLCFTTAHAQQPPANWLYKYWNASWITMPGISGQEYGVYHFRKDFTLTAKPDKFVIRVSADNRYRLFVNGHVVGNGPAQGSPWQWNYDTYDIAPLLQTGSNVIASQVWNYGVYSPWVQMSVKTGFVLEGETSSVGTSSIVNTDTSWRVMPNTAFHAFPLDPTKVWEFIIVSPGDSIDARHYPWGWEQPNYISANWLPARTLVKAAPYGTGTDLWWQLTPRIVPYLQEDTLRFQQVRRGTLPAGFINGHTAWIIPAHSKVSVLLDQVAETTAFPEMLVKDGKDAVVTLNYAEALMFPNHDKGNRNDINGKELYGLADRFICDGGTRLFRPLQFRSYRYVQVDVVTQETPLTISQLYAQYNHVVHPSPASFSTSDTSFNKILQTAWHTQDVCMKDYLLTDAYYEQLQYIGDNRIQALLLNSMGYDQAMVKNMIWQYYMSRTPEGILQSRFPCKIPQVSPTYSLLWICMLHDYTQYYKDDTFTRPLLSAVTTILDWYEQRLSHGLAGPAPFFNFIDWTPQWDWNNDNALGGMPPAANEGGSAIVTLQLAYALRAAADLLPAYATRYNTLADKLTKQVYLTCWDSRQQLLADTPDKTEFSQHTNIFGVLTNAIPVPIQKKVIHRVAFDSTLIQTSVYFRFYLGQAYKKAGLADEYLSLMQPWQDMLDEGLSTFAELPGHARSDCHPWSCSPLYEFYATICGITPSGAKVLIQPALGKLQWVKAGTQQGLIIELQRVAVKGIKGFITLPAGMSGTFVWAGENIALKTGRNEILF
jgi:alpha-L-rhamnosidase